VRISITEIVVRVFNFFNTFTVLRELLIVFCEDLVYLIYAEDGMLNSEIPIESQKLFKAASFSFTIQPLSKKSFRILMRENSYLIERMKRWYI